MKNNNSKLKILLNLLRCFPSSSLRFRFNEGQAAMVAVSFFLFVSLAVAGGVATFAVNELKSADVLAKSKQSLSFIEGASEDAAFRIASQKNVPAQFSYSEGTLSATNTIAALDEYTKDILTEGAQSDVKRKNHVLMEKVYKANLLFGGLVGEGGLFMQNTSKIEGDVHTNGSITGQNSPQITGDASAVGTISDPPEVLGTITEGASPRTMPIPEFVLDDWESSAEEGGVVTCSDGDEHSIESDTTIGPAKIPCNLEISGSPTVTLTGRIWVEGDIEIENTAVVQLDSSYGDKSEVIIAHNPSDVGGSGKISVQNSAQILGSGTAGSYIMMVSRNNSAENGGNETAIDIKNSSSASIYYAPHGKINVQNSSSNVHLKTVTAWQLELKNKSVVEYEEELAEVKIPAEAWVVTSWGETQ